MSAPGGDRLSGQWAVVTGAGRGVGRAVAFALAEHGCSLALVARTESELGAVAAECLGRGAPAARPYPADLGEADLVDALADGVLHDLGRVDILVNNAGFALTGNATQGDPREWDRMLALNLSAPMHLTRRFAPGMVEREHGTVINIGSIAAIEPMKTAGAYAATKFGLRGWSLSCYEHLRGHGVKVVLINPAFVNTTMTAATGGVRMDRMLLPEDVARAAMLAVETSPMCCPQEITLRLTRPAAG